MKAVIVIRGDRARRLPNFFSSWICHDVSLGRGISPGAVTAVHRGGNLQRQGRRGIGLTPARETYWGPSEHIV